MSAIRIGEYFSRLLLAAIHLLRMALNRDGGHGTDMCTAAVPASRRVRLRGGPARVPACAVFPAGHEGVCIRLGGTVAHSPFGRDRGAAPRQRGAQVGRACSVSVVSRRCTGPRMVCSCTGRVGAAPDRGGANAPGMRRGGTRLVMDWQRLAPANTRRQMAVTALAGVLLGLGGVTAGTSLVQASERGGLFHFF